MKTLKTAAITLLALLVVVTAVFTAHTTYAYDDATAETANTQTDTAETNGECNVTIRYVSSKDGTEIVPPQTIMLHSKDALEKADAEANNEYTVYVRYAYADGTEAAPAYTTKVNVGSPYSTTSPYVPNRSPIAAHEPHFALAIGNIRFPLKTIATTEKVGPSQYVVNYQPDVATPAIAATLYCIGIVTIILCGSAIFQDERRRADATK